MNLKHVYLTFLFTLSSARNDPQELEVPGPLDLADFQSLIAPAQSRAGLHASSVIADAQSVLSKVASAVLSDLKPKISEAFATETPSSATSGVSPKVAAGLALLNRAIGVAAG